MLTMKHNTDLQKVMPRSLEIETFILFVKTTAHYQEAQMDIQLNLKNNASLFLCCTDM